MEVEQCSVIEEERENLEKDVSLLEQTEGFKLLTERQKRIIKLSLYLQQRAERGTDSASLAAIISPKTHVTENVEIMPEDHLDEMFRREVSLYKPEKRKYKDSQNHIANWYCHAAIANLEAEDGISSKPPEIPEEFFDADFQRVQSDTVLKTRLANHGFPCVVHISNNQTPNNDWAKKHSMLVLGHDSTGKMIVWDKKGYRFTYRVTDIDEIYKEYGSGNDGYYWGIRDLHTLRD